MSERIVFGRRIKQVIDFSGLQFGSIMPTDIDGCIDWHGRALVLMEYKYRDTPLPYGQQIALTRMIDMAEATGKRAVLMVCEHEQADPEKNVEAADARVREIYHRGKWYEIGYKPTVREMTERFLKGA